MLVRNTRYSIAVAVLVSVWGCGEQPAQAPAPAATPPAPAAPTVDSEPEDDQIAISNARTAAAFSEVDALER